MNFYKEALRKISVRAFRWVAALPPAPQDFRDPSEGDGKLGGKTTESSKLNQKVVLDDESKSDPDDIIDAAFEKIE